MIRDEVLLFFGVYGQHLGHVRFAELRGRLVVRVDPGVPLVAALVEAGPAVFAAARLRYYN